MPVYDALRWSMIDVRLAATSDIEDLIELESALFAEDAGQHDPHADITWPEREGRKDFEDLVASPDSVLLVATMAGKAVGFLVGYAAHSSSTRQPIQYAVLRSLYVSPDVRRGGLAQSLIDVFLTWARERGCAEAHVDHYEANAGAGALYEGLGFRPRSIARTLAL